MVNKVLSKRQNVTLKRGTEVIGYCIDKENKCVTSIKTDNGLVCSVIPCDVVVNSMGP